MMEASETTPAQRMLLAWVDLETALRTALPACSVAPPTQPAELLAALRILQRIGAEEEVEVMALRETRNRIAHQPQEPPEAEALLYESRVRALRERLGAQARAGAG